MQNMERQLVEDVIAKLAVANFEYIGQNDEVRFEYDDGNRGTLDAAVRVRLPSGDVLELAIEAMSTAYPRDVRHAVERLRAYMNHRNCEGEPHVSAVVPIVAAQHLSAGSRDALRQAGINYFDTSGTLYFQHGTWLIDIERASKDPLARKIGSVFSGAREQVVHAMLMHWRRTEGREWISGAELADMARTSAYTVSMTLQEMERHDWVQSTGKGPTQRRRLVDAVAVLDAWAGAWTQRAETRTRWYAYAGRDGIADLLLQGLAGREGWALTGAAAANAMVPHLTSVDRAVVIVPPGRSQVWAEEMKLQRAEKGSNVVFVEREGAALLFLDEYPGRADSRIASPFIQYLDLLDGYGRNKELAAEYRHRVLKMEEGDG